MAKIALVMLSLSICAAPVVAQGWYLAATAGVMDVDISGVDDATNAGVLIGYDVYSKEIFSATVEAEFTTTVSDGDLKASGNKGEWDIDTQAAYLAFRLGEEFFGKVRFGLARTDISASIGGSSVSGSDSSGSWGAAVGWMFSEHWGVQADSTLLETDISYWNLGLHYRF